MVSKCKNCKAEFRHNPSQGGTYCCAKCHQKDRYRQNVSNWLEKKITGRQRDDRPAGFVRRYLLEECNYACTECGWSKVNPFNGIIYLEIDHIDGNRQNGYRENLRVLCPNCHSLTEKYKTLNKNIGYHKKRALIDTG